MSASSQSRSRDTLVLIAALAWLPAFCGHFFVQPVANDASFRRTEILAQTHWLLLDNVLPAADEQTRNSGWRYFPQRLDLLAVAGTMLWSVWSAGQLALRGLRIEPATRAERIVFAFGLGFSAWTLVTLALGLGGLLSRWGFVALMSAVIGSEWGWRIRQRRSVAVTSRKTDAKLAERRFFGGPRLPQVVCVAVAPFLLAMLLGSMLPTTDFDVKEYHLQGPKEWSQQGRIEFLPHNVYTSFPFLTEMVSLWGMVLRGDWFRGALTGQVVLMAFAPLTAIAIFAIGRAASTTAGWIGAGVYLTIPWVYRISVIAYAEGGLTFFLAATCLAWMTWRRGGAGPHASRGVLLCGLFAGSALACKYPGLVSVTVPMGAAVVVTASRHSGKFNLQGALTAAAVFSAGAAITFGPWALKNLVQTGNPVYPLAYTIFGGEDWTPELNEKWRNGHSAPVHLLRQPGLIPADLWYHMQAVAAGSVWQSPLVFGLAPLALVTIWPLRRRNEASSSTPAAGETAARRLVGSLVLFAGWLFLTWWALTHRIDRFWLPMLPIVCTLAGIGGAMLIERVERLADAGRRGVATVGAIGLTGLLIVAAAYNLAFVTTSIAGNNTFLLDETAARRVAMQATPSMALLDARLPAGARVLLVGEAAVFDAPFALRYNTVFDFELLQAWATDDPLSLYKEDIPLKSRDEILAKLRAEGITHVFVNWLEILRYRAPRSYTYTDFISPRMIQKLVALGVLSPVPLSPQEKLVRYEDLLPGQQQELDRWGPELRTNYVQGGQSIPAVVAYELYTVMP